MELFINKASLYKELEVFEISREIENNKQGILHENNKQGISTCSSQKATFSTIIHALFYINPCNLFRKVNEFF